MRFLSILISFWLIPVVAGAQLQFGSLGELLGYADQHGAAARQARLQPGIARQDVNIPPGRVGQQGRVGELSYTADASLLPGIGDKGSTEAEF